MNAILALDQGTTSSRAIVFDHNGVNRGVAQHELTQIFPDAGWVEHDLLEIWRTQIEVARAVLKKVGMAAADIAGVTKRVLFFVQLAQMSLQWQQNRKPCGHWWKRARGRENGL